MKKTNNKGFSLIELLVVIAIMAVLAGVGVAGYSIYTAEAEKAADNQLISVINEAFAGACWDNDDDIHWVESVGIRITDKKVSFIDKYADDFWKHFGDNVNATFYRVKGLYFDAKEHKFKAVSEAYGNLLGTFNINDINAFNGSLFAQIGVSDLMDQVDMATQLAMGAAEGSRLYDMVFDPANISALAEYLGYDYSDDEERAAFDAEFEALAVQRFNQLVAAGADISDEDKYDAVFFQATQEILANTAVLVAATKSTYDPNEFKEQLALGNGKDTIKDSMDNATDNQEALSQTAMAYAMYTSYMKYIGQEPTTDVVAVLDVLDDPEFMAYMTTQQATDDLNGYLGAMNMVESASGNKEAVSNLVVNGFKDPSLTGALNQELGRTE